MLYGDVESNPGPLSVDSLSDSNSDSLSFSISNLTNSLSIMHLNIQSPVPKLDLTEDESLAYDVLVLTEHVVYILYVLDFYRLSEQTGATAREVS